MNRNPYTITFNIFAILVLLATYALMAQLDQPKREEKVAANVCGNAGWKFAKDGKTIICIPRHGKPYTAKL